MNQRSVDNQIYMDYAAATPVRSCVREAMKPYYTDVFANPSAVHAHGRAAGEALASFRERTASVFFAKPEEIIYTSGATEANALAIIGVLSAAADTNSLEGIHAVASSIEHSSVLEMLGRLSKTQNLSVTYIKPKQNGIVDPNDVGDAVQANTAIISCMHVNSEIGTIQPIREIANICDRAESQNNLQSAGSGSYPVLHTDASQSPLFLDISSQHLQADLITVDAQKIYGPKGVGVLYKESSVVAEPLYSGGGQEFGLRSGTQSLHQIAGMTKSLEYAQENRDSYSEDINKLQNEFIRRIEKNLPVARINGSINQRAPSNISITFPETNHSFFATQLDQRGVSVATKSACMEDGEEGSRVISELQDENSTQGALRFSLGESNDSDQIDYAIEQIKDIRT